MRESAFDVVSIPARMNVLHAVNHAEVRMRSPVPGRDTYDICAMSSSSESFSASEAVMFALTNNR